MDECRSSSDTYTIVIAGTRNGPPSLEPPARQDFCCSSPERAAVGRRRLFNDWFTWYSALHGPASKNVSSVFDLEANKNLESVQNPLADRRATRRSLAAASAWSGRPEGRPLLLLAPGSWRVLLERRDRRARREIEISADSANSALVQPRRPIGKPALDFSRPSAGRGASRGPSYCSASYRCARDTAMRDSRSWLRLRRHRDEVVELDEARLRVLRGSPSVARGARTRNVRYSAGL